MSEAKFVTVPKYDEISVKQVFPKFLDDSKVMEYLQDEYPKDRYPDRAYFFTVLNTVHPEYVGNMIVHANSARFAADGEANARQTVDINEEWWDKLQSMPFISRKYIKIANSRRIER